MYSHVELECTFSAASTIASELSVFVVDATRLVEQTEAHILVGLLLLLLLLFFLRRFGFSSSTGGGSWSCTTGTGTARWDRGELRLAFGDQLY